MCINGSCTSSASPVDGGGGSDTGVAIIDKDVDGVADDKDNCLDKKNADQADEDGDHLGDACDLCPQISGAPATDSDGDGIGDTCDPRPTVRDTVWLYEGFRSGLPAAWAKTAHWMWMSATGSVQTTSPGNARTDGEWLDTPFVTAMTPPDNFRVTVMVAVQQLGMGADGDHSAGVEVFDANALPPLGAGVRCGLDQFSSSGTTLFLLDDFNNGVDKLTPYSWTINTQYRLIMTRQGSTYTCTVFGPNGPNDTKSLSGSSQVVPRNIDDSVDIWAFGSTAQFGSVQIVGPP